MSHMGPISWSSVLPKCSNTFSQGWATRFAWRQGLQRYIDFGVETHPYRVALEMFSLPDRLSETANQQHLPFGNQELLENVVKQLLLSKPVI